MNTNIKLLALDIDGTLMGRDYIMQQPVIDAIKRVKQETNIKVILASGRMTYSTKPVAEQLGIDDPVVIYQGAMVNDIKNQKILFHQTVPPELGHEIIADIEKENIHVNLYINDKLCMKQLSEIAKTYSSYRYVEPHLITDYSIIDKTPPTKILGLDHDLEKINDLKQRLIEKYCPALNIFSSCPMFIEVVSPNVSKGDTLITFAKERWDINPENIMAIGDADNDFEMLTHVGYSVAMGNATKKAIGAAKYKTDTVENLGVVKAIEKYIFNEVSI